METSTGDISASKTVSLASPVKHARANIAFFYLGLLVFPLSWAVLIILELITLDPIEVGGLSPRSFCQSFPASFLRSMSLPTTSATTTTKPR